MSEVRTIEVTDELKTRVTDRVHRVLGKLVTVENVHGAGSDAIRELHAELAAARDDVVEIFGLGSQVSALRAPGDKE